MTAPYRLVLGDALDVLKGLEPGSVDAVVTDPPYCAGAIGEAQRTRAPGQGLRSENIRRFGWFVGDNMGTAGLSFLLRSIATEALRVVRPSGSLLIFCDWRMLPTLAPSIESSGVRYQGLVVWDKGSMGLGTGFRHQHELVLHFTVGSPEYHDLGTSDVLRSKRVVADDREHQTQKPVDLMRSLLRVVTPPEGTILDPFMGSGSTGVACAEEGFRFIGVEREERYFEIAEKRIRQAYAQGRLFA